MDRSTTVALAERFMRLFAGMKQAYGTYNINSTREDGKRIGAAVTKRGEVTVELWEKHLAGTQGLGIVPIREDNTCHFGAIDVDVYNLDHKDLANKIIRNSLPLIPCRTKSGGVHLYCFSRDPVPASSMKTKLGEVAAFLGYGGQEIFPKQTQILVDQGDVGQWINMPYFSGVRGMRYAVSKSGDAMSPEQFLEYAYDHLAPTSWFSALLIISQEFEDGPPCLQVLSQLGYPDGTRNNGLYNIGVYLKRSHPDDWETTIDDYNHKYMEPPLPISDVQGVIKSLKKKDYTYGCAKQPIAQHCNAALCRTRKYGVGSGTTGRFPMLGGLTKLNTKPPIWFWTIDGVRMELSTEDLQDPRRFQRRCMDYINMMPQLPGAPVWQAAVQHAMDTVTVIEAPVDASPEGQFWEMVEKFCTGRAQAQTLEEIALGKPFSDSGRTNFRLQDLLAFFSRQKFFEFRSTKIASLLRDAGAEHHFSMLKGRGTNYWSLPEFARQESPFDIPGIIKEGEAPF